ncbi:MAG: bifunctional hydroxymethylpyrimidine kinase/phosphomethylpyrimidine kinase [Bryobacteraceae bacterium]
MTASRVALTIAGSDPSGGAGIQADLKTFHQFGVYGEAVLTLITVQNSVRSSRVEVLAPDLVAEQIAAVLEDMPPDAAKTGALGSAAVVRVVAEAARGFAFPLVVDPVMDGKHGLAFAGGDTLSVLRAELLPLAALLTPNLAEAEALTGMRIASPEDMRRAARELIRLGAQAVLIKGGHLAGEPLDIGFDGQSFREFSGERIATRHTHGTGCTYSAAITAGLARGVPLWEAVAAARRFVQEAIRTNPGLGHGNGPLNHHADAGLA